MPDTVIVAFYKQSGFISTAVRWFTRRPGQAFADVPSHTALIVLGPGPSIFIAGPLAISVTDDSAPSPLPGEPALIPTQNASHLTNTQMRVLEFVAEGMDAPEIAATLCISPRTVEQHFLNLSQLFGSCNRVKWLLAIGSWIPGEPDALRGERVTGPPPSWEAMQEGAMQAEPQPQYHGEKCVCCQCPCRHETMVGMMWTVPMCQTCNARLNIVRAESAAKKEAYLENAKAAAAKDRERRREKDRRRTQKYQTETGGG